MKHSTLLKTAALALIATAFIGCDLLTQSEDDSSSSSSSTTSAASGDIAIDTLNTNGINIRVFQDEDGTIVVNNQTVTVTTTNGVTTTETASAEAESDDSANLATLYLDVYISPNKDDLFSNDARLYDTFAGDEWDAYGYGLTAANIKGFLGIDEFAIGETFYWGVKVTNDGAKVLGTLTNAVRVTPPLNNTDTFIGYDFRGWYIQTSYDTYEDMVVDFHYGEDTALKNTISNVDGFEVGGSTYYRAYLPSTFTVAAGTVYYAYPVAKNLAWNVATTGETDRVEAHSSVSLVSIWDFQADYTASSVDLSDVAQTLTDRSFTLSWNTLEPLDLDSAEYTLYLGTANPPTTVGTYEIAYDGVNGRYEADIDGLMYDTTYYAYVSAVGTYDNGSSVAVADRTWTSPVVTFATPNPLQSPLYTFTSGLDLPTAAVTNAPGEIIRTGGTVVDYGDPAPAYSMGGANTIATTMGTAANTYTGATFDFSMKASALQNCWALYFDDQNNSSLGFDPTSYSAAAPSAQYAAIKGPVLALQYYADDPTTTTANDPVYALIGYYLNADNTVDIDPAVAGTDPDVDTNPDVVAVRLGTFTTFSAGLPAKYNTYHDFSVTVATTGTPQLSVSMDGGTAQTMSISTFSTNTANSVNITGLNRMYFQALNDIMVDNVQFTASNGATAYMPSMR